MIVYQGNKQDFGEHVILNKIDSVILDFYKKNLGRSTSQSEIASWRSSMQYMNNVLLDPEIRIDLGVVIEYQVPQTSKRIDFIITGQNEQQKSFAILVELKQWEKAQLTDKDAVVATYVGGKVREVSHPSYQAWSYASLLNGFNEAVYTNNIQLVPCAYLHNYANDQIINHTFYSSHIEKAPLFLKDDVANLRSFIKKFIRFGDKENIILKIENGRIKPSKALADSLSQMLKGNQEFILIDDQKVVYETAISLALRSSESKKNVLIVEGGPGTGKSVVAINLLVELTKKGLFSQYVSKNAAPRTVYEAKLKGTFKKTEISNLFSGSGAFIACEQNRFDALIVDEAHRLNEKSGMFRNLGENQIKEIISASKFAIFFIDENQKVTLQDIGQKEEIQKWAEKFDASITTVELSSQFRCNGSDAYLAWLDHILGIRETANITLEGLNYEFKLVDSPQELHDQIKKLNSLKNSARMVAGYCWEWNSRKDSRLNDIIIEDHNFAAKWNLTEDGNLWIINPDSVNEIGCIHTCQGLEVDYIGVIIGPDLVYDDGEVKVDPTKRAKSDASLKGYKTLLTNDPENAKQTIKSIIKNTYRTLMTRGMKGCYIHVCDEKLREYFRKHINLSVSE